MSSDVPLSLMNVKSDSTKGCPAPVFLQARGVHFEAKDNKIEVFPSGAKLILKCANGSFPYPKDRAKCSCKRENDCKWSKLSKVKCINTY